MRYFEGMKFDDPDHYQEEPCSCNRAIPKDHMVQYDIPRKMPGGGFVVEQVFLDRDCPHHGYTRIEASELAENG